MKELQRWECRVATNANGRPYIDDIEYSSGRYVLHSDHEAEIARLRAQLEGLRMTLEIIAVGDSRTPHIDAAQALIRSGYWADEIDAAMGASA